MRSGVRGETRYLGEDAVTLQFGRYEAVVLPRWGGNVVAFRRPDAGWSFLREPESFERFSEHPGVYGIPILFPPNRYADGTFTLFGRTYQFPINEPARHNFIHGFLNQLPWKVLGRGFTRRAAYVVLTHAVDVGHPFYTYFPHRFQLTLAYTLSAAGLSQWVRVRNRSPEPMPVMLGFHTAFSFPFNPGSAIEDCRLSVDIGQRLELDDRALPTGAVLPLDRVEQAFKAEGANPMVESFDNHYTVAHPGQVNQASIRDANIGVSLIYRVDPRFRYWMVWNDGARGRFVCVEPQTNMVNAPNLPNPEALGVVRLDPGQRLHTHSAILIRKKSQV
ncbi:aldose 1-epimerase [Sulfobacillus harzensis]|uniref:Aldose 1-epimerase n=1 Tax=Sulfobacillus harzensis TaxID=2729629 RepID=A0A7Y0L4L8_9FIRM|nr:aldose 1-epimerase [Sulfobacillus harzensis]NMP22867.1 aldose 1-epimerase [Sulfobacillus harzensis]